MAFTVLLMLNCRLENGGMRNLAPRDNFERGLVYPSSSGYGMCNLPRNSKDVTSETPECEDLSDIRTTGSGSRARGKPG